MLILSRHRDESIITDLSILIPLIRSNPDELALILATPMSVTIVDIRGDKVRLGCNAHSMIPVHREEVVEAIKANGSRRTVPPKAITAGEIRTNERGELL